MSSDSPPPLSLQHTIQSKLQGTSGARSSCSSPFRTLLESPTTLSQHRLAATTTSLTPATQSQPPRPMSVLPDILTTPPHRQHSNSPPQRSDAGGDIVDRSRHDFHHSSRPPSVSELAASSNRTSTTLDPPECPPSTPPLASSPNSGPPSSNDSVSIVPQQFCLRWNNYQSNLTSVFDQLLQNESFVDVTLACDSRSIKAHKVVLSACSPYFQNLFSETPCHHPIVIMRDVNWSDLKAIVEFMYKGEINVSQDQIGPLLRLAEMLKVRGLADVSGCAATGSSSSSGVPVIDTDTDRMQTQTPSPKLMRRGSRSPIINKTCTQEQKSPTAQQKYAHQPASEVVETLFAFNEPEKKLRLSRIDDWQFSTHPPNILPESGASNIELQFSALHQQAHPHQQLARNIRKRRWPSADTVFNPPPSPLSGLIAAERAERERERAQDRTMLTSPASTGGTHLTTSGLDAASARLNTPSPSTTPAPSHHTQQQLARAPSAGRALTPSPHVTQQKQQQPYLSVQTQAHYPQHLSQTHASQRASPASSLASTHPSSIISGAMTASPATSTAGSRGDVGSTGGPSDSSRFQLGAAAQAAMAAAAAAAQIDLNTASAAMGIPHATQQQAPQGGSALQSHAHPSSHHGTSLADDLEIKPGIAEMIREEERAKMLENSHAWMGASSSSIADSYQYQLQSMWQKCWNTNQNLMHHLRFRERGPLKSWRPETMAEAIFSVLKEGLSLSQAARKYDIPYPTFVLYANRVHNMLGPSIDGGPDLRPKGRGRPQRILLGIWPDEHIKGVIKTVVFRDAKDLKEESSLITHLPYGRHSPVFPFQDTPLSYAGVSGPCPNGIPTPTGEQMSQEATAAAVAAVAHNIRQQMQMAAAVQHQHVSESTAGLFNLPPHMQATTGGPQMPGTGPGGIPLPKASISPALSTSSNTASGGPMLGPRHAPSPCGPNLPGLPNLPPSMAVALQMVGGPGGRCDPTAALLSQQQQHQLQQLHLQQQHALQQQQQQQQQQQHAGVHQLSYGNTQLGSGQLVASSTSASISAITTPTTATITSGGLQMQSTTQPVSSATSISIASTSKLKASPHRSETPIHSPLTELSLELSGFKSSRSVGVFSPTRLFADDIADLVGTVTVGCNAGPATTTATITSSINTSGSAATTTATASITAAMTPSIDNNASLTSNNGVSSGSTSVKAEPITSNE